MKQEIKKTGKKVDKLLMGVVIGGAIGSVLGMALSPKSGKENREIAKKKAEEVWGKAEKVTEDFVAKQEKAHGIRPNKKMPLYKRALKLLGFKKD